MKLLYAALICLLLPVACAARIITVDDDGPADFSSIQAAIDDANDGDTIVVQPGIYTGDGNRDIDFKGKAVTVRSENGPENCIVDCKGTETQPHRAFYFHSGEEQNSIVNGLTVTNGFHTHRGGGIYCYQSSPIIENCSITNCGNDGHGGGINCHKGSPKIRDCIITGNFSYGNGGGLSFYRSSALVINCMINGNSVAYGDGGGIICEESSAAFRDCVITANVSMSQNGGGISCEKDCSPMFSDCLISGNLAGALGGGVYCNDSCPTIIMCTISGNSALSGGGVHCQVSSTAKITKCLINGNSARGAGGIDCWDASPIIINCTVVGNSSQERAGGLECDIGASPAVTNSILWGNSSSGGMDASAQIHSRNSTPLLNYSYIQGSVAGRFGLPGGNINQNPCFVQAGCRDPNGAWVDGDYHLKSQAGRWDPNSQAWVKDDVTSPCIDAGDPSSPIGYEPFPNGGIINMGVYGGRAEASKSYFGRPVCETIVAGDINGDCKVDWADFRLLALHWLEDKN